MYQGKKDLKTFLKFARAQFEEKEEEHLYRIYMSDSLNYSVEGRRFTKRFADFINPQPIDDRSGDEIAEEVINRLGLRF